MFLAVGHGQEGRVNNVQTLKERLSSLYDSENPTPWAAESLASAKLLSALHTIQQRDTFASKTLAKEAKEALGILRNCIVGGVSAAATSGARITPIKSPAQAAAGRILVPPGKKPSSAAPPVTVRITTAPRKPLSPKNNVSQPPKGTITPPRRQKKGCDDGHYPLERYRTTTADGDLSERLRTSRESLALLDTVACVLGIYEHTFLRISYLRFVKAITQGRLLEQFTLVCLDLAYEYQQLGKSGRVEAMFAQAEAAASNPDVNAETRILLLLRKAEHISSTGRANER